MAIGFKGFSTIDKKFANKFTLTGFELAKQDLLNHFHIRKGEKLHNPNFGSMIWDLLFSPLTEAAIQSIQDDVQTIISYDPRLAAENIIIYQYEHGILIEATVTYIPDQRVENLLFDFNTDTNNITLGIL